MHLAPMKPPGSILRTRRRRREHPMRSSPKPGSPCVACKFLCRRLLMCVVMIGVHAAAAAAAPVKIGVVGSVQGNVSGITEGGGDAEALKAGDDIFLNETIRTEE